jgi:hypothetical protein
MESQWIEFTIGRLIDQQLSDEQIMLYLAARLKACRDKAERQAVKS